MIIIKNASFFEEKKLIQNKNILIHGKKIVDISSSLKFKQKKIDLKNIKIIDAKSHLVIPGFIDIQVNGGNGFHFHEDLNKENVQRILNVHLISGTTSLLPTFVTEDIVDLKKNLSLIEQLIKEKQAGILGVHIEGPFLSQAKKGIHAEEFLTTPNENILQFLLNLNMSSKLITLAPEVVSLEVIQKLKKGGFKVFAGHTNASFETSIQAFNKGVIGITHLFNACSQISAREAGVVGAALTHSDIWCGLIADGKHVDYNVIKLALKLKSFEKFLLVSDAMAGVGSTQKSFQFFNETIFIKDDMFVNEYGTLAGANLTMLKAFKNVLQEKLVSLPEAIMMTSTNQAKCFGLQKKKGRIAPNFDADLLVVNKNDFKIKSVIQLGHELTF